MKSFRRSRSIYLRATSSSLDDRDDDNSVNVLLIRDGPQPPIRRCRSLLLESIHKLNCSSSSKGVALLSQSDVSIDCTVDNSHCGIPPMPSIDSVIVYPSLNVNHGAAKHFGTKQYNKTRRCEDDASDDALTAPRRFLSPSKLQAKYNWNQTPVHGVLPQEHEVPVDTPLSDIPECVVITHRSNDPFYYRNVDAIDSDSNAESSPFHASFHENISISFRHLSPDLIMEKREHRAVEPDRSAIHQPENALLVDSAFHTPISGKARDGRNGTYENNIESAQPRHIDFEFQEFGSQYQDLDKDDCNRQRRSDVPSYDSNVSRDVSFWNEGVPSTQRTFYLASSTEETAKMSSLSRKLQTDQRRISPQASDTSFATTKSGATQATSHSTSTGISRSSRKTQELIRRFERHHLQKSGYTTNDKDTIQLPA